MTPAITTLIPISDITVISSCPIAAAPNAETAGISAEKTLAFIIPKFAIEVTQNRNATHEQSIASDSNGTITSIEKNVLLSPSSPNPKKNGRKRSAPIRNW